MFRKKNKAKPNLGTAASHDSDESFLEDVYRGLLGRAADGVGKDHYLSFLRKGNTRLSVILDIIQTEEFVNKVIRENVRPVAITQERPSQFQTGFDKGMARRIPVFKVEQDSDFDWLEDKILENGYYDMPGAVWSMQITEDKRLMAEVAARLKPQTLLDIGCANGAIMKCLDDRGISVWGNDISRMARSRAFSEVRDRILLGDLLELDFPQKFDVILGLDIFEHFNPNKLDHYIAKIYNLLEDGGYLYANIPAFGKDPVFGEIFPLYLDDWKDDVAAQRCFRTIHVDGQGYPLHGHIIGGDYAWWIGQFTRAGFRREQDIEQALHRQFDAAIDRVSVARKAFYVFSKNAETKKAASILNGL